MSNTNPIHKNLIGKAVAIRGIGSGVNVGRCVAIDGPNILLEPGSFFCRQWEYDQSVSYGAFHSLSKVDVHGGSISKVKHDTIITDVAQIVVCDEEIIDVLDKIAK